MLRLLGALGLVAGAMFTVVPAARADQLAHGPVRAVDSYVVAAVGYQRAPARLDPSGKRWLVYSVLPETENGTDEGWLLLAAVRTAARTMRLATGPVETPSLPPTIE
ncbi:hypothetical protein OJ998_20615 [Solirubrobacter taibaiensis]|nr:hypothetical protein [Solirubrobacter taibaiensis]